MSFDPRGLPSAEAVADVPDRTGGGSRAWRGFLVALWPRPARWCLLGLVVLVLVWGVGLGLFVSADGRRALTVTLPSLEPHPAGEHNLVAYRYGTVLRASSYYRASGSQHHPAFLVDGRIQPTMLEKWASDSGDTAPWVELLWSGERRVRRVRIQHAGAVEAAELTSPRYRITCLATRPAAFLLVTDNQAQVAEHGLDCADARGLHIDFSPGTGDRMVRVFEIEVWGE
jgi:hypothetical protein